MEYVLIICDRYITIPSSNGIVASNLVKELSKDNKVIVISLYDAVDFCIGDYGEEIYSLAIKKTKTNLFYNLFYYKQDLKVVKKIEDIFLELHKKYIFKYVIGIFRPIEAIISGLKIHKKYKIPFFPLFLDIVEFGYSNNLKKRIVSFNYRRLYNKIVAHNYIFALKDYKKYFERRVREKSKVIFIGLPSVLQNNDEFDEGFFDKNKTIISYCGCFYSKERNPKQILEYLRFIIGSNIQLHFFSYGCEEILTKYKNLFGDNLMLHGFKERKELKRIISSSDFFLNISNDSELQIPGKIYEYFSTGKPIINFKFRKNDAGNMVYDKYPLIYTIDTNENFNENRFIEFINNKKNKTIKFSEVEKIYFDCTPKYFVDMINDLL